jgi:hypothetical protein
MPGVTAWQLRPVLFLLMADRSMAAIAPVAELLHGNFLRFGPSEWRSTLSDRDAQDYGQRTRGSALDGLPSVAALGRDEVATLSMLQFRVASTMRRRSSGSA